MKTALADRALLVAVAVAVVVAIDAVGALLVTVVLTVPAATVRLFEPDLRTQQFATFGLTAVEGVVAVIVADAFNVGPGPALAVLGAAMYGVAAAVAPRVRAVARPREATA